MNVAYNEISCADASRMIGVDYSTVAGWCRKGIINCINLSEGTKNGRYRLSEDEVLYIKKLKEKFDTNFIRKYRKDWKKGMSVSTNVVPAEPVVEKPVATIKSVVVNMTKEEPAKSDKIDIDEIAIKIGYIQDIKDKIEKLEQEKQKLVEEYDKLRAEVIQAL